MLALVRYVGSSVFYVAFMVVVTSSLAIRQQ